MSTDYYALCEKCEKKSPVAYSRQAWGWGNCRPTGLYNFLIKHTRECGEENLKILNEWDACDYPTCDENCGYELRGFVE